jgi:hypothetical protein
MIHVRAHLAPEPDKARRRTDQLAEEFRSAFGRELPVLSGFGICSAAPASAGLPAGERPAPERPASGSDGAATRAIAGE